MAKVLQRRPVQSSGVNLSAGRGYPFFYVVDLPATAAGANNSATINIDASNDFQVSAFLFSANFSSGVAVISRTNLVGTLAAAATPNFESVELENGVKLPRFGPNIAGAQSMPGLHQIRLGVKTNDRDWQSSPVRADLITGEPGNLFFFPKEPIIQANSSLAVTLYNDMPAGSNDGTGSKLRGIKGNAAGNVAPTVAAQLILFGSKLVRG